MKVRAGYGNAILGGVCWSDIRDRIFGRIDPVAAGAKDYRVNGPNTSAFLGHAAFTGLKSLRIDSGNDVGKEITADQIVIATGARPTVPLTVNESGVPFHICAVRGQRQRERGVAQLRGW